MTNYQPGDKVQLRMWGGIVVEAEIIKVTPLFNLVKYLIRSLVHPRTKAAWYPKWRMWK